VIKYKLQLDERISHMPDASTTNFVNVGDHVALNLLNTVVTENGEKLDLLQSDLDVLSWLRTFELAPDKNAKLPRSAKNELLVSTRRLRDASLQLVVARKTGVASTPHVLNEFLRQGLSFHQLRWPSSPKEACVPYRVVMRTVDSPSALLRPVAEAVAELLETGDFELIRKCENPECSMLFYDRTKSHRRRWCSAALCGNRMKVAAFRERLKQKIQ
jgi:predicted RNA-binding Zn ribbon-like protein